MLATLSHYRVIEKIGAGGMGVVFRAHDEHLDRDVALKVLSPRTGVESSTRKRFHKEALALSKINHPNIATIHDFGTEDGADFLVEEFIEGRSLDAVLTRGPLLEKEVIHLALQLTEGLAAAHKDGIVHRDLKPSNLRITPDGRLKIVDFGLAIILRREVSATAITESLTETNAIAGTLPYMAPEQLLGRNVDPRTDIWAAGCVLYEMATGHRPFAGSGISLSDAILHRPPTPISELNPAISTALDRLIQKCLDKDPDRRYQSAEEIVVDLQRAASTPIATGLRLKLKHSLFALVFAAAVTVVIAIGMGVKTTILGKWSGKQARKSATQGQTVPHESYLVGMKQLERWDKSASLETAISSFEQTVKANPDFALGFSALGEAYWAKYRLDHDARWLDSAEINSRRAAELNAQLPAVFVTLARVHNGKGQYNLALEEVQRALKLAPLDPDALLAEATVYASMERRLEAENIYKRAAALRPQYWGGYYELGVFYFRTQRYADAAAEFEHVLQLTPDNAVAHATLGAVLQLLGKLTEAEARLKESISLQPSYAAFTNLGVLYYTQRRWAESAATTRNALAINANDWSAWSNLGLAYEWMGRKSDAEEAFRNEVVRLEELAKVRSDDASVQVNLGVLYSRQQLREKALAMIEAALARSPEDPAILVSAGEAYENLGDRNRALKLVTQAMVKGWTLAQLENDPGQQQLLRDPRFRDSVSHLHKPFSHAQ